MMTFDQAIQNLLRIKRSGKATTYKYYNYIFGTIRKAAEITNLSNQAFAKLTSADYSDVMTAINDTSNFGEVGKTTREKIRKGLIMLDNLYIDEEIIKRNRARLLPKIGCAAKSYMPYTEQEICAMLSVADQGAMACRDRAIIQVLLDTGIRAHELVMLATEDHNNETLHVREGKGSKERWVTIGDHTINTLQNYVLHHRVAGSDKLFTGRGGRPLTVSSLNKSIKRWQKLSKINHASSHRFRATFATQFIGRNKGSLEVLRILMGHQSIETTMRYVHLQAKKDAGKISRRHSVVDEHSQGHQDP